MSCVYDKCSANKICYNCFRSLECHKNYQLLKELFPLSDEQKESLKSMDWTYEELQKHHILGIIREILKSIQ